MVSHKWYEASAFAKASADRRSFSGGSSASSGTRRIQGIQRLISGLGLSAALALGCAAPLAEQPPPQSSGEPRQSSQPASQPAPANTNDKVKLPNNKDSVRFAVIGDAGTGGSAQVLVAKQLAAFRAMFPFEFAIMLGGNLYGSERPADYKEKFEIPYKPLLDAGVKFYAALGNHDDPSQRMYKPFNMNGERFYTFKTGRLLKPDITGPNISTSASSPRRESGISSAAARRSCDGATSAPAASPRRATMRATRSCWSRSTATRCTSRRSMRTAARSTRARSSGTFSRQAQVRHSMLSVDC